MSSGEASVPRPAIPISPNPLTEKKRPSLLRGEETKDQRKGVMPTNTPLIGLALLHPPPASGTQLMLGPGLTLLPKQSWTVT